jgi:UDP-N-acetylglucosamine--N-acetylmuramyl-(pentapeptide) pyrophosphoryl-undecaprenol N-acetylglucosamine transferase
MRVVIGTGGTAGHVFPALAVAEHLRDAGDAEVLFLGRARGQEADLVREAGFPMETVAALPFVRKASLDALRAPVAAFRAARRARPIVRDADVVLGMGGYVSVPAALAARSESVPLILHEQNVTPGLANRVAGRWARAVAVSFEETVARFRRGVLTGNPVRGSIVRAREAREPLGKEARAALGLEEGRKTILLLGGSQGAVRLNRLAVDLCGLLGHRSDLQMILLTGPRQYEQIRRDLPHPAGMLVSAHPFMERIDLAYAIADVAVSRAGASAVAELTVCGVPAILVPYPYATGGHQEANARTLERAGAATVVLDGEAGGPELARRLDRLFERPDQLEAMGDAARRFGRPDAAGAVARLAASGARDRAR